MSSEKEIPISEAEFSTLMERVGPFESNPVIAVAYSGGADSTALAILASRWVNRRGGMIYALTIDHGLRPESAAEARMAQNRARKLGLSGAILRWQNHNPTTGIQNAARQARYDLMTRWCRRKGILHLLLGHHQEDQAETLLHRLGRHTGSDGLAGMAGIRETADIRLLRPCLHVSRERLRAVAVKNNVEWVEDPSNSDPAFARVRLRNLLPALENEQISADALAESARKQAQVRQSMERHTAAAVAENVELNVLGYARVRLEILLNDAEVSRRILERLLGTIGGNFYPARRKSLENLLYDIRKSGLAKPRTLAGCRIFRKKGDIFVAREARRCEEKSVFNGNWTDWDGRFRLRINNFKGIGRRKFFIRALQGNFSRKMAKNSECFQFPNLNSAVRSSLPSIWDHQGLVCVPHLGYGRTTRNPASVVRVQVEFLPNRPVTNAIFPVV
ncbi:MAG: tRNA lysidine(34) synthetase TilS [Rhodospirillaceae bacterium]|nr:tRNA lysidine(34) synthetase TilS [Rhodospirillaceae bacterium]|tara:strand:- start:11660 stop:13000 length:1341 start_codon:yes stop_codon:yes gene_type:complete